MKKYPIAPNGIVRTVQGEGSLVGIPMTFLRLAGCSVGCQQCDTNYTVDRRLALKPLVKEVANLSSEGDWVWITGGEPTDHDIRPLCRELRETMGFRVAVATAGVRLLSRASDYLDWISVSPHDLANWKLRQAQEVKFVFGLNGLTPSALQSFLDAPGSMACGDRWVQPCHGMPETVSQCVEWVESHDGWRMGFQAHRQWGLA